MDENKKYLIRLKSGKKNPAYLQRGSNACYSPDVGTGIHETLPSYVNEKGNEEYEVISSEDPEFREILERELFGTSRIPGLERSIEIDEQRLERKKKNRGLIRDCLDKLEGED